MNGVNHNHQNAIPNLSNNQSDSSCDESPTDKDDSGDSLIGLEVN